jgi:hypothetical protein
MMRKTELSDYITARLETLNEVLDLGLGMPFDQKDILREHLVECYEWLHDIMTTQYKEYRIVRNLHSDQEWNEIENHLALFEEEKILKANKHALRCAVNNRKNRPYILRKQYVRDKEAEARRKEANKKKRASRKTTDGSTENPAT